MTVAFRNVASNNGSSSASIVVTIPSTTLGSTLVVSGGYAGTGTMTGATASGASFTQVPGVLFATDQTWEGDLWIAQNVPAGITSVTANFSAGIGDGAFVWELSPAVLDTAATAALRSGATTGIAIPNTDAGAILIEATLCSVSALINSVFTGDGATNGNPSGHCSPGDTAGRTPGFDTTLAFYWCWGASFKDPVPWPPDSTPSIRIPTAVVSTSR